MSAAYLVAAFLGVMPAQTDCIFITGQSVATGYDAAPALSTTQTLGNKKATTLYNTLGGVSAVASPWPLSDLVEASGETPASGMANTYASLTGRSVVVFGNAVPGQGYSYMARGTTPWTYFERQVEGWGARTQVVNQCHAVAISGESDSANSSFSANLTTWQSDIQNKFRAATRVTNPVLLYVTQNPSCTLSGYSSMSTCVSPIQQYNAAKGNSLIKLVGPRYQYTHTAATAHPNNTSSRLHGCKIGEAMASGASWQPFWPTAVARDGAVITVTMHVPVPPIVIDTTTVTGVDATTRGFEYTDAGTPPSISSVDCSAACTGTACTCVITLGSTPTGSSKKIRYAYSGTPGNDPGPASGMRGNLRDSSTVQCVGPGTAMPNWLVHFEETVP